MNKRQKKLASQLINLIQETLFQSDQIRLITDELGILEYYSPIFSCLKLPDNSISWSSPPNIEFLKRIQGLDEGSDHQIGPEVEKILVRFSMVAAEIIRNSEPIKSRVAELRKSGHNHRLTVLFYAKPPSPHIH